MQQTGKNSTLKDNYVRVTGGTVNNTNTTYGGTFGANATAASTLTGNYVEISGGTATGAVYGAYTLSTGADSALTENSVTIDNTNKTRSAATYGAYSTGAGSTLTGNKVEITGGTISSNTRYGAQTTGTGGDLDNNIVSLKGTATDRLTFSGSVSSNEFIFGAKTASGGAKGNELNLEYVDLINTQSSISVVRIGAAYSSSSGTAKNLDGNTVNIRNSKIDNFQIVGARAEESGSDSANYNTVLIYDSDINNQIYGGRARGKAQRTDKQSGEPDLTANYNLVLIEDSKFSSVWGAQTNGSGEQLINDSKYNVVKISNSQLADNIKETSAFMIRGGTSYGSGAVEYNTVDISNTTIDTTAQDKEIEIDIMSGYSQGSGKGDVNYNQLILEEVNLKSKYYEGNTNHIYGGLATNESVIGNRVLANNVNFEVSDTPDGSRSAYLIGGRVLEASDGSVANDNVVVVTGNTYIGGIIGGEVKGTADNVEASRNLVILKDENVNVRGHVYGGYAQKDDSGTVTVTPATHKNVVYFMNGTVKGVVGGANHEIDVGQGGAMIVGNEEGTNFGSRSAGNIANFEKIAFNVVKKDTTPSGGTDDNTMIKLTGATDTAADINT